MGWQKNLSWTPVRHHNSTDNICTAYMNSNGLSMWPGTLLRAATLWASWASISGSVSALCRVCWSFCLASSRRSCICLFFSSLWMHEKEQLLHLRSNSDSECKSCVSDGDSLVCVVTPCLRVHFLVCLWYRGETLLLSGRWDTCIQQYIKIFQLLPAW